MLSVLEAMFEENSACAIIKDFSSTELRRALSSISFANKLSPEAKTPYLSSMLQQIMIIVSLAKSKRAHLSSDEFASQVADFISEAIEEKRFLSLDEIAKSFFVSKFYLCRAFKSYSGISVHAYINRKRILLAKQYIDSGMSAGLAAEAVGYQDYSAFYRAYVSVMGVSPKSKKG
jgi:AraC-like DNA-binding protein